MTTKSVMPWLFMGVLTLPSIRNVEGGTDLLPSCVFVRGFLVLILRQGVHKGGGAPRSNLIVEGETNVRRLGVLVSAVGESGDSEFCQIGNP